MNTQPNTPASRNEAVANFDVRQFLAALVIRNRKDCGMFPQVADEVDADDAAYHRILKLLDFYYPRSALAAPGSAVDVREEGQVASAVPEGCTPADARMLRAANHGLAAENDRLREALQFYADGSHFTMHDADAWDTVSGEPANFYEDEANTATVEDGSVAKLALANNSAPSEALSPATVAQPSAAPGDGQGELTGAEVDTLVALVERGPLGDGDVPSKSGRDGLVERGLAARILVHGQDGYQAATYAGRDAYQERYGAAQSTEEATANRITTRAIRTARKDSQ